MLHNLGNGASIGSDHRSTRGHRLRHRASHSLVECWVEQYITGPVDMSDLFVRQLAKVPNGFLQTHRLYGLCLPGSECRSHLDQTDILLVLLLERGHDPKNSSQVLSRIIAPHMQNVEPPGLNPVASFERFHCARAVVGQESGSHTVIPHEQTASLNA